MGPEEAGRRFLWGLALGLPLGICYSLLRPLRRRRSGWADALFMGCVLYAWLWHSFAVCAGDLRLASAGGLPLGFLLWEVGPGRLLRPLFFRFWHIIGRIWRFFTLPLRKIFQILKKICCIWPKMG